VVNATTPVTIGNQAVSVSPISNNNVDVTLGNTTLPMTVGTPQVVTISGVDYIARVDTTGTVTFDQVTK
jgi:hypothetical protein